MSFIKIERVIHREDPYEASDAADAAMRRAIVRDRSRLDYFAGREVVNPDGTFPFGEGFLYSEDTPRARDRGWHNGHGVPSLVCKAGHRGSKRQQQDAYDAARLMIGGKEAAVLAVADGVSGSGKLASPASQCAVNAFMHHFRNEVRRIPHNEAKRHAYIERAIVHAAFAANFEVIRQVLFDRAQDGRFDRDDKTELNWEHGIKLPVGPLNVAQMQMFAPQLDDAIVAFEEEGLSALATFAVSVAVDNDLYTFSTGDAVVGMYRPSRESGKRVIHLTHRDQAVVELFRNGDNEYREYPDLYENVITSSLGDSALLTGTLRRYPNLLEPGDRVFACSDGIGPRSSGRGLDRFGVENVLNVAGPEGAAVALVDAQLDGLDRREYQDNIGVAVLSVA